MTRLVVAALLLATPALAGTIPLRAGSLDFEYVMTGDGPVHLEGRGFEFDGYAQDAFLTAADCAYPCEPGETLFVRATVEGNDLPGFATWQGEQYSDVGDLVSANQLALHISGRMRLPRIGQQRIVTRTARGRLTGTFWHATVPMRPAVETLVGYTVATVTLEQLEDYGEMEWHVIGLSYDVN